MAILAMRDHICGLVKQIGNGSHQVCLRDDMGDNDHGDHGDGREQHKVEDVYVTLVVSQKLHGITCVAE